MVEVTDEELVARCRAGEEQAWNELVERFGRYVHAICVQAFRLSPHDAEDVFQEVFSRAFVRLSSLRSDSAVRPWLAQLTRNCCIDRLRASARVSPVGEPFADGADEAIELLDEALVVRGALAELSPECQEVLDRFFGRDESYRTIGEELGLPSGTIASRISRCLGRLRSLLEGRSGAPDPSGGTVNR